VLPCGVAEKKKSTFIFWTILFENTVMNQFESLDPFLFLNFVSFALAQLNSKEDVVSPIPGEVWPCWEF